MALKIFFAGTPEFAAIILQRIIESDYRVYGIYTQPDRPSGRGQRLTPSPVKKVGITHNIPIYQPKTLKDKSIQDQFKALTPDILIVAAYGLILPLSILNTPLLGCINVHASLLPRWRGAAPIQRALLAGDKETGVSIMKMDVGLDTGSVIRMNTYAIQKTDTAATIHDHLAELGAESLLACLPMQVENKCSYTPQNEAQACYAPKITKEEAFLNWNQSAVLLDRKVRAFNPWPVAKIQIQDQVLKVWEATVLENSRLTPPGTILRADKLGIDIATGEGILRLLKIQPAGKRVMAAQDYINAHPLTVGTQLLAVTA
ncbi:methionyl-tRNA formyltransferase [Candidatus Nitrosacidococcus tergens]|uniref:Methionyl-tRNA formyltransferase n=1 Tax=Candidatus Nitrosacidococcus tergens TaxID=553981 RepID=A0A7G1QBL2_9GAMM|nr:methionyl-tRNA formyltransferase [Candidatus Nitrosacidococcus tergens]CAB1277298.1 10-formyltetrahydrofolate:L-methionyl-tRNA(fMet) N-formyltransferase [Candidatus Nitrosacidococcus tergens]